IDTWPVALLRRPSDTDVPPDLRVGSNRLLQPVSPVSSVSSVSPCPAGAIMSSSAKARPGAAREREAVRDAPSVPVDADGAGPKGMVAVSDSAWPWGAPCPVQDPAHG